MREEQSFIHGTLLQKLCLPCTFCQAVIGQYVSLKQGYRTRRKKTWGPRNRVSDTGKRGRDFPGRMLHSKPREQPVYKAGDARGPERISLRKKKKLQDFLVSFTIWKGVLQFLQKI